MEIRLFVAVHEADEVRVIGAYTSHADAELAVYEDFRNNCIDPDDEDADLAAAALLAGLREPNTFSKPTIQRSFSDYADQAWSIQEI